VDEPARRIVGERPPIQRFSVRVQLCLLPGRQGKNRKQCSANDTGDERPVAVQRGQPARQAATPTTAMYLIVIGDQRVFRVRR
jgi:hypothetical protein